MKKCIILANGQPPKKSIVKYLVKSGYEKIICADGGANSAYKMKLIPDYIIGDFDSINKETLKFYKDKCKIIKITRQNDTDVEKCLKYAIKKKYTEVILLGATGDRLDHSFCNLGIVLKFSKKVNVRVIHQKSILSVHSGIFILRTIPGEIISLYGFDSKTKIKSAGLKYRLNNISLQFGKKESTSNIAISSEIKLQIKQGQIFIIRDFNSLRKNDLI